MVAVDPIAEMLEVLSTALPDTPALLGTAEHIPLPDNSVDAVLVAQAWHWFDPRAGGRGGGARPAARWPARPGVEYPRRTAGLGQGLGRIIGHERPARSSEPAPAVHRADRHQVEWTNYLTPQALIDLVASRSYCITSPGEVRTRTLDQVRELLATHPALANSSGLALPYITVCIRGYGAGLNPGEAGWTVPASSCPAGRSSRRRRPSPRDTVVIVAKAIR